MATQYTKIDTEIKSILPYLLAESSIVLIDILKSYGFPEEKIPHLIDDWFDGLKRQEDSIISRLAVMEMDNEIS